ncbi:MAG: hypothetical protein AAAB11_15885 [Rhizobium giardinii]
MNDRCILISMISAAGALPHPSSQPPSPDAQETLRPAKPIGYVERDIS